MALSWKQVGLDAVKTNPILCLGCCAASQPGGSSHGFREGLAMLRDFEHAHAHIRTPIMRGRSEVLHGVLLTEALGIPVQ